MATPLNGSMHPYRRCLLLYVGSGSGSIRGRSASGKLAGRQRRKIVRPWCRPNAIIIVPNHDDRSRQARQRVAIPRRSTTQLESVTCLEGTAVPLYWSQVLDGARWTRPAHVLARPESVDMEDATRYITSRPAVGGVGTLSYCGEVTN